MVDIYYISESDERFDPTLMDEFDPVKIYINQIVMILGTESQVMGAGDLSVDLENLIYETKISAERIRKIITQKLEKYCSFYNNFPTNINVKFFEGTERDVCLIDINVDGLSIKFEVK